METINDMIYYSLNKFENSRRIMWQNLQFDFDLSDVTLVCEYKEIKAHKIVISSSSPVIKTILKQCNFQNPCILFSGIKFQELANLVHYMYQGEVNIAKENINSFLESAQYFKINGIFEEKKETGNIEKFDYPYEIKRNKEDSNQTTRSSINEYDTNKEKISFESNKHTKSSMYQCYQCNYETTDESKFFEHKKWEDDCKKKSEANFLKDEMIDMDLLTKMRQKYLKLRGNGQDIDFRSNSIQKDSYIPEKEQEKGFSCAVRQKYLKLRENSKDMDFRSNIIQKYSNMPEKAKEKGFSCDICDKQYSQSGGLNEHKLTVHKGIRHPCKLCAYKGTTKDALKRHVQSIHEGVRYQCTLCELKETTKSSLAQHKRILHDKIPYPCDKCDYKATTLRSLTTHKIRDHNGDKFICEQCNYVTVEKSTLKRHVLSIHIGIKLSCDKCDFQTKHGRNMKRHVRSFHRK